MFGLMLLMIFSGLFAAVYFIAISFIPTVDVRTAKILKRINSGSGGGAGGRGRLTGGYIQTVEFAASRVRSVNRYSAGSGVYGALKRLISKMICLSDGRRAVIDKKLRRAGYAAGAELFYADVILRVAGVCTLIPAFILLDNMVAAAATAILGVSLYYKWAGEPDARIRKLNAEIADELPRFVSVLSHSMTTDRDLTLAVEKYLKIAKPALRADLELLLLELKAGNSADALKQFDGRLENPQLSAFISGLIDAGRGIDQKTFFYLMEENMKQSFIENKKRELAGRPAKVKKAIIAVGLCMFAIYLVPICVQLLDGMSMFK